MREVDVVGLFIDGEIDDGGGVDFVLVSHCRGGVGGGEEEVAVVVDGFVMRGDG